MSPEPPKKKRKQQEAEPSQRVITPENYLSNSKKPKKKKNAPEGEEDFVVRWQNPALQADLVLEKVRTLNPKMSAIELGELSLPGPN
jgi:hypothetical protein